jgi:enoyl-CoA hydratase/carnithine racemase
LLHTPTASVQAHGGRVDNKVSIETAVPVLAGVHRLNGHSHPLDLILTGRGVSGQEALRKGLANRLVPTGRARPEVIAPAREIAARPQAALRNDRLSSSPILSDPPCLSAERSARS